VNNLSLCNFVYYKARSDWPGFGRIRRLSASEMAGKFLLITIAPVSKNCAKVVFSSSIALICLLVIQYCSVRLAMYLAAILLHSMIPIWSPVSMFLSTSSVRPTKFLTILGILFGYQHLSNKILNNSRYFIRLATSLQQHS